MSVNGQSKAPDRYLQDTEDLALVCRPLAYQDHIAFNCQKVWQLTEMEFYLLRIDEIGI